MGISSAMFSGVSGLNTLGNAMTVIGDNIANVNTIGFKASRTTFETLLAQSVTGASGTSQVGRGVALSAVDAVWFQGSFEGTNQATDMAIGGKGFFMVRSPETGMFYTRAGHFLFDESGFLVNPAGLRVQGWILDPNSPDPRGAITDIQINATSSAPRSTENIDIAVNLNNQSTFLQSPGTVESDATTRSGFVFDNGANSILNFNDGNAFTIDLIADTPLEDGTVYTGEQVAEALQNALNDPLLGAAQPGDYLVNYDSSANRFTITNNGVAGLGIAVASTAAPVFGFAAGDSVAAGGTGTGNEVAFTVTEKNNVFSISVDNNAAVTVVLATGEYTIPGLRYELENKINQELANAEQSVRVDVRYDDVRNRFQITSNSRGEGSAIQLSPTTNNFLPTITTTNYTENIGTVSNGFTNPGFTESRALTTSGFIFNANNVTLLVGGAPVSLTGATGFELFTVYSGDEVAGFLEELLGAGFNVSYDSVTDRFTIQSTAGATIDWDDPASTAARTLGFVTAEAVADSVITAGGSVSSVSAVAFNIIAGQNDRLDIIANGNPANSGTAIRVVIREGVYTGDSLASELQRQINTALSAEGENERVNVNFNEVDQTQGGRFRIASSELGSDSTMQLVFAYDPASPPQNLVAGTLNIDDNTVNSGQGFQVTNPDDTANYSTSLVVYDTLGNQHATTFYFRKASVSDINNRTTWEWFAFVPASDTASGEPEIQARGTLVFDQNGQLRSESDVQWMTTTTDVDGNIVPGTGFNFGFGAEPQQEIDVSFGLGSNTNVSTQFAAPSSTIFQTQDGYGSGFLQDVSVDKDGVVSGNYSNGQVLFLARVALANFINPWGLSREGGNLYSETRRSGQPITGTPGSAGLGVIAPNSLEQSNVDLSTEFVNMIIQQRGFQANSRVITTTDDMLAELINLKR